jgi:predicted dehydrogenase/threonine dehydrogenase-like Zn-dependent dehydrogenase
MRQVCLNERQQVIVAEIPAPSASPGHALIRTAYSLISSGTELAATNQPPQPQRSALVSRINLAQKLGTSLLREGIRPTLNRIERRRNPLPVFQGRGYIAAGEVIHVGEGIDDLQVGDLVACGGGSANHAEIISVPRNLIVRVPPRVNLRDACFTTLGAIAMQGVRRAEVNFGETVVVTGLGLIGQLVSQLLQVAGCRVIAVDLMDQRLALAKELGAHHTVHANSENPVEAVYQLAGEHGADAVIICAATQSDVPVNQAFQMCRERGRVIIVGDVGMSLERTHFYHKELDLLISRSYGPGRYDPEYEQLGIDYPIGYVRWTENRNMAEFVRLLEDGKLSIAPLVSAEYEVEQAADAYRDLAERSKEILGVVFRYDNKTVGVDSRIIHLKRSVEQGKDKLRFAVIGAGSFARAYHIPNLRKIPDCELTAISTSTGVKARQVAQEFDAAYCTTDYRDVLADKDIDAVLIATRHHLHAEMAIAAARSGKHIFIEKPLALTLEDCQKVCEAVADAGVLLTVGFNRRFASLVRELKQILNGIPGPKMLTYRVNAGHLPPDHWTLDASQGGGRIIGEGCHFFDLLYYLTGAEPIRTGASLALAPEGQAKDPSNMSASITFADGSVGTLLYTAIGHKDLPKERLEVFAGGKAFTLDDFNTLEVYGMQHQKSSATQGDKGHAQLLHHFCDAVRGKTALEITAQDGLRATLCALKALESIRTGTFADLRLEGSQVSTSSQRLTTAAPY